MAASAAAVMEELRGSFREGRTRPAEWRTAQLRALVRMIEEKEDDISDALHADLAKPRMEAYLHEVCSTSISISNLQVDSNRIYRRILGLVRTERNSSSVCTILSPSACPCVIASRL